MASKKDTLRSTKDTPASYLTLDELVQELASRSRKYVFVAIMDDRKEGGIQTIIRRSETAGDTILLLEHAKQFCEVDWNFNTFGPEMDNEDEPPELVG